MKIHLFRNHTVNELQMIPKGPEGNRTADRQGGSKGVSLRFSCPMDFWHSPVYRQPCVPSIWCRLPPLRL